GIVRRQAEQLVQFAPAILYVVGGFIHERGVTFRGASLRRQKDVSYLLDAKGKTTVRDSPARTCTVVCCVRGPRLSVQLALISKEYVRAVLASSGVMKERSKPACVINLSLIQTLASVAGTCTVM